MATCWARTGLADGGRYPAWAHIASRCRSGERQENFPGPQATLLLRLVRAYLGFRLEAGCRCPRPLTGVEVCEGKYHRAVSAPAGRPRGICPDAGRRSARAVRRGGHCPACFPRGGAIEHVRTRPSYGGAEDAEPADFPVWRENPHCGRPLSLSDMHDTASGISPATTFAREYLKCRARRCRRPHHPGAHGDTGFTRAAATRTWTVGAASAPEFDLPALAVTQTLDGIAAARAAGYALTSRASSGTKGEYNSSMSTSGYSAKLDAPNCRFPGRLAAPNLPFVVGRMSPEGIAATPGRDNVDRSHLRNPGAGCLHRICPSMAGGVNTAIGHTFPGPASNSWGGPTFPAIGRPPAALRSVPHSSVPTIERRRDGRSHTHAVPGAWGPANLSAWPISGTTRISRLTVPQVPRTPRGPASWTDASR